MSKKVLKVEGITNELEGASLFFAPTNQSPYTSPLPVMTPEPVSDSKLIPPTEDNPPVLHNEEKNKGIKKQLTQTVQRASKQASVIYNESNDPVESIRKTVKRVGKEVFFVRVTPEEKHTLVSIIYSFNEIYREEGRKTSENEIGRIGLNFLLEDYRANGNNSILARVLAALNA
jgi:hypothetical protein